MAGYEEPSETPEETDSVDESDSSSDDGTGLPEENGEDTGSTDENYGETTEENTVLLIATNRRNR